MYIVNSNCQFSDWVCWSLVLLSAFYRIFPKIPLAKSMQTFLEMSTNLNYVCQFFNNKVHYNMLIDSNYITLRYDGYHTFLCVFILLFMCFLKLYFVLSSRMSYLHFRFSMTSDRIFVKFLWIHQLFIDHFWLSIE